MYLSPPISHYCQPSYPTITPIPDRPKPKLVYDKRYEEDEEWNYYKNQATLPKYSDTYKPEQTTAIYNQLNDQDIRLIAYAMHEEVLFRKELTQMSKQLQQLSPYLIPLFQMFTLDSPYKIEKFRFIEVIQSYQDDIKICDVDLLFSYLNEWRLNTISITYSQFCHMIIKNADYSVLPNVSDLKMKQDMAPEQHIEYMMRIIRMNLQMLSTIEYMRQRLEKSLCNMGQLFEFIDADRDGWIKAFEITKFLQQFGLLAPIEETSMLLRDIDERGQINLVNFIRYYKPKSLAVYL